MKHMEEKQHVDKTELHMTIFLIIIGVVMCGLILFTLLAHFSPNPARETRRNLASLQLQGEAKEAATGCFIYGSGIYSSKAKTCYYFYEEQQGGGYKLVKLDTDDVLICPELEEGEQPYEVIATDICGCERCRKMYLPKDAIQMQYDASISNVEAKGDADSTCCGGSVSDKT